MAPERSKAMKKLLSSIIRWIEHSETRELENYLAQSTTPADLERRMRDWETRNRGFNHLP
jgi:uncharacterized protein YjiS (DUF1127 family)